MNQFEMESMNMFAVVFQSLVKSARAGLIWYSVPYQYQSLKLKRLNVLQHESLHEIVNRHTAQASTKLRCKQYTMSARNNPFLAVKVNHKITKKVVKLLCACMAIELPHTMRRSTLTSQQGIRNFRRRDQPAR
jgi:hypothetical protein